MEAGEVFGFLGPNGAGKSTTIDMLLGFTAPTTGSISALGMDAREESTDKRKHVGVLPEGLGLYDRLSGRRHLEFAIRWTDATDDPAALLDRVGLDDEDAVRPVGEYSKGMRQRLALAMALVDDPQVLILDEPSTGLDPHEIRRLREIVRDERDRGATVFFSSHILGQVEAVCDRVGILYEGELVAVDTIDGLRKTVGSGTELQLRIADDLDADRADDLDVDIEGIAGVSAVEYADGIVRVQTVDSTAKARVVTRLADAGITVLDIDSAEPSLEDVFTAYTTDDPDPDTADDRREASRYAADDRRDAGVEVSHR